MVEGQEKRLNENYEIMEEFQAVREIALKVEQEKRGLSDCDLAVKIVRLMSGDTKIIDELPTLKSTFERSGVFSGNNKVEKNLMEMTSEESITNSKGLLGLTKENVIDIKNYINKALELRTTEKEVEQFLGYTKDSIISKTHPEFSPTSFVKFYTPFNTHAKKWNELETSIITQGNNLTLYGKNFISHSNFVIEKILKRMDLFSTKVEDAVLETEGDEKKLVDVGKLLDRWQKETEEYYSSTSELLLKLNKFDDELENELNPSINKMISLMENLDLNKEAKKLRTDIESLNLSIEAKQKEYDKNCGLACTGAAGLIAGPLVFITWAVTGGVYGARAEKIRKEKNELEKNLKEKQRRLNELNSVADNIYRAGSGIEELRVGIRNAITGLKALNTVWDLITKYIDNAKKSLMSIEKQNELFEFIFELENAKSSWESIPAITEELLKLFKEANEEVNRRKNYMQIIKTDTVLKNNVFDRDIWNDKYSELNDVRIDINSKYMPLLQQKAFELKGYAKEIYQDVTGFFELTLPAKTLKNHLNLYLELKEKNNTEKIEKLMNKITDDVKILDNKLYENIKKMYDNIEILVKNTRIDLKNIGFYSQLNTECKRFEKVIQRHSEMLNEYFIKPILLLKEEIKSIDKDIDSKIDPQNIIKEFKEFLPSQEEISGLLEEGAVAGGDVTLKGIEVLYSTMLSGLDILGKSIKLCQDIEKQTELVDKLIELERKYDEMKKENDEMIRDHNELRELIKLHDILKFFVENGKEEINILEKLRKKLLIDTTYPIRYEELSAKLEEFLDNKSSLNSCSKIII